MLPACVFLQSLSVMSYKTLVGTEVLAKHLGNPDWVILDCRFTLTDTHAGRRAYEKAHIPGAVYVYLEDDLSAPVAATSGRHPLPDPKLLAGKFGKWGIDECKQVVVYDDTFGAMAGRCWWLLRWLGHDNVAMLDGVYPKWMREGRPVTTGITVPQPANFSAHPRDYLWVDVADVEQALASNNYKLFDARAEERFSGDIEPLDAVAGHIPGAINIPYEDNLDIGGDFLSSKELHADYLARIGNTPSDRVIHMCGSGVTACHNVLAMEHAGFAGTKLYVGSWSQWITDSSRPVELGE